MSLPACQLIWGCLRTTRSRCSSRKVLESVNADARSRVRPGSDPGLTLLRASAVDFAERERQCAVSVPDGWLRLDRLENPSRGHVADGARPGPPWSQTHRESPRDH